MTITVENLGKKYFIGSIQDRPTNFRESITKNVFKTFQQVSSFFKGEASAATGLNQAVWALKDVSFSVEPGETVGIIGHNGAGKSTLLKILSRITYPTCGKAVLQGRIGSLLEVGTGFHPDLSGRENIFLNGSMLGMSYHEIKKHFDEIVEFAEVGKFIDTPMKHYSSGMYVRLAFSVAAHLNAEILILDEVLAVGDIRFQKKCLGKMDDVAQSGRTILFVSHDISAFKAFCQRGLFISNGKLVADGPMDKVIETYLQDMSKENAEQEWEGNLRPGNHAYKINRITAKAAGQHQSSRFPISKPINFEIEFEVIEDKSQAAFSLLLYTVEGYAICNLLSNHDEKLHGSPLKKGIYTTRCTIPGHFLNEGSYYFTLNGFSSNWSDEFQLPGGIKIDTYDDGVLKKDYFGQFKGFVRPCFEWETQPI